MFPLPEFPPCFRVCVIRKRSHKNDVYQYSCGLIWHLCIQMQALLSLFICLVCLGQQYVTSSVEPPAGLRPNLTPKFAEDHDPPLERHHEQHRWLHQISLSSLGGVLEHSCALLAIPPCSDNLRTLLSKLAIIFKDDPNIFIGLLVAQNLDNYTIADTRSSTSQPSNKFTNTSVIDEIAWKSTYLKQVDQMKANMDPPKLAFYQREPKDRTCLLMPPKTKFQAEPYSGRLIVEMLVQFLNERCGAFQTPTGTLTAAGLFHEHIMKHLYVPKEMSEDCRRIKVPQSTDFFQEYFFRSRPVVIENAVKDWPAMRKWTPGYLRGLYGEKQIHIKLTEDGNFEGVESAKEWGDYHDDWIPESVKKQLPFSDLVVVRPATAEMKFSDFLDFISTRNDSMYSAYLEYSSIPYYMPQLEKDIHELPFLKNLLERRQLNMWLSDGNTLGKLHFDPYDNFLCQISGEKHLTLFDPHHNENLYEAHIPEAILSFTPSTSKFHRHTLLESTSMVMSPVDIQEPNMERFPNFDKARRVHCVLRPGDVLFMPAFWWHEVQSFPDKVERRNLAVNFWYEPLMKKEFPCAECRLKYNSFYRHFLYTPPGS